MTDINQLQKTQSRTFVLVCLNLSLFFILFLGAGFVIWQSAALILQLQENLTSAERAIDDMERQVERMDTDAIAQRVVSTATEQLAESILDLVQRSELNETVQHLSVRLEATRALIAETATVVRDFNRTVEGFDEERLSREVSYQLLKGLGDGFQQAAESRKPASMQRP